MHSAGEAPTSRPEPLRGWTAPARNSHGQRGRLHERKPYSKSIVAAAQLSMGLDQAWLQSTARR